MSDEKIVIGNVDGFANALARFVEPITIIVLAAEILNHSDIKQNSWFAKQVIKCAEELAK